MKFLITGITGFVGPHLAKILLDDGHEVHGITRNLANFNDIKDTVDNSQILYHNSDLSESMKHIFRGTKFDGIFHLGAETHPPTSFEQPQKYFRTNAVGTVNLVNTVQEHAPNCHFMYCSTSEVYGICPANSKVDETFPIAPMNPYAVSKATGELYVQERLRNNFLKGFITRAFSHTGPRRKNNYSISSDAYQIAKIIKREQYPVVKVGNLSCKRVVMDVRDVANVYYQLMLKSLKDKLPTNKVFNIGGDELHEIGYFLDLMLDLFNVSVETEIEPKFYRKIDIPVQWPDSTKVRKFLNWKPTIPIETTLTDLVNYWLKKL